MKKKRNIHWFLQIPYKIWNYTIKPTLGIPDFSKIKYTEIQKQYAQCLEYFKTNTKKGDEDGVLLVQMVEDYEFGTKMAAVTKVLAEKNNLRVGFYRVLINWITNKNKKKTLTEKLLDKKLIKIYSSFGNKMLFDNNEKFKDEVFIQKKLKEAIDALDKNNAAGLLNLMFDDIMVGDLIYDTYLRFYHQPTIEKINDDVIHIIEVALHVFYNFKLFLKNTPVKILVNTYSSYIHHGIPARICLNQNIDVYTVGSYSYLVQKLSKEYPYHQIDHSLFSPNKEITQQKLEIARDIFTSRFAGKIDAATSYMRQSAFSDKKLDPKVKEMFAKENRNVVLYAHDFYDSPHVNRMLQFPDLYQFLKQTLEALTDLKGTGLFIKTHPNGIKGCKEKTIELVNSFNCKHFHILDEEVSNLHIIDLKPDLIATARGTVCVEMAYFEIPTVALYDNLYANFDFVHTCKNTAAYFAILKGEEKPVIHFDKQKIYSFYYQAFLEKTVKGVNNEFEILSSFKGSTFSDDYLQLLVSNKDKLFCDTFLGYYTKALLN